MAPTVLKEYELADQLAAARAVANDQTSINQQKNYLFPLLGERPVLDTNSIYVRFALAEADPANCQRLLLNVHPAPSL